jgi:hypothetical protein
VATFAIYCLDFKSEMLFLWGKAVLYVKIPQGNVKTDLE